MSLHLRPTAYENYFLDDEGNVWSKKSKKLRKLKPQFSRGYKYFGFYLDSGEKRIALHTLICTAYHGERPSVNHQVRHLDGDKQNNEPSNLAWGTQKENELDKIAHGRNLFGSKHGRSVLKEADIPKIIRLRSKGLTYDRIGKIFGVHFSTIYRITKGISWKHQKGVSRGSQS